MTEKEIWKSIPGWEGLYVVSNLARVKRLPYTKGKGKHVYSETILKPYKNNSGYYMVALFTNNKRKNMLLHRAVAMAFIPNPNNFPFVNHKDSNRLNCIVENLEWCNRRARISWRKGESNAKAKQIIQLSKESKFIKRFGCIMDAERETGILNSSIVSCLKGHHKTAGGYKWEYVI